LGAQRFAARALETFFRRWWLFLLPALLVSAFGLYSHMKQGKSYRSLSTLSVASESFLGQLTQVRNQGFTYEAPSVTFARQFNEYMSTDEFALRLADKAGLTPELKIGLFSLGQLRASVYATPNGDSLMTINAYSEDPHRAQLMAGAAIDTYRAWVTENETGASDAAEAFLTTQLQGYQDTVSQAQAAYDQYIREHPAPAKGVDRDQSEIVEIQRLDSDLTRAQTALDGAKQKIDEAKLASVQSSADIGQRLRVIDPPTLPTVASGGLKDLIISLGLFGVLGALLTVGAVCIVAVFDRSIRTAADLSRLGIDIRATVPRSRGLSVSLPPPVTSIDKNRGDKKASKPKQPPMRSAG